MDSEQKNRAIIFIPRACIIELVTPLQSSDGFVTKFVPLGLPKTARCIACFDDTARDSIGCILEDDSFETTPPGSTLPMIHVKWECVKLAIDNSNAF